MKNVKKRVLSLVLMLAIVVALFPTMSFKTNAGSETVVVEYSLSSDGFLRVTDVVGDTVYFDYIYGVVTSHASRSKSSFESTDINVDDCFGFNSSSTKYYPIDDIQTATVPAALPDDGHDYHRYVINIANVESAGSTVEYGYYAQYQYGSFQYLQRETVTQLIDWYKVCSIGICYSTNSAGTVFGYCDFMTNYLTAKPEKKEEDKPVHNHNMDWVVSEEPTFDKPGVQTYRCIECDYVKNSQPINRDGVVYATFNESLDNQLKAAAPGATVKLDLGYWHSIPKVFMEKIVQCGHDVEITYIYEGTNYDITVPANSGLVGDVPWYGPLYLNSIYGK